VAEPALSEISGHYMSHFEKKGDGEVKGTADLGPCG
jgi:hypothetical protein